jgi:PPK2 family polyphosphate:nucleotide phosphotransferase
MSPKEYGKKKHPSKEVLERRGRIYAELRVEPGAPANLAGRSSRWDQEDEFGELSEKELKATAKAFLAEGIEELSSAQELLWANDRYAVLVVFQALDAAGKDSTIEHVMTGVNPQGVEVVSFRKPSPEELDHDFLWRINNALPERGRIGIFNRSHYEEVIALRVHPEWLAGQNLPPRPIDESFWDDRYEDINAFERHLERSGTKIVKFFLNVSKAEQKRRFISRLDVPGKEWKFKAADVAERQRWDDYTDAFEKAITATSKPWAPWFVIPADDKKVMQAMVVKIIAQVIEALDLNWPTVSEDEREANREARKVLEAEPD